MAQRLVTSFINTVIPGAYPNITVKSNAVGLGSSGIVAIIGEADGGASYSSVALSSNAFTPDQLALVKSQYISGPIVDAFAALASPSNDADITGTANSVFIIKTNTSTKASALVDTDYGTLSDQNFGKGGNNFKFQITTTAAEVAPSVSGSTIPTFGAALNAMTFSVRLNGGASTAITLSGTSSDHNSVSTLITELNALLTTASLAITASTGAASNSIKLSVNVDASANRKGSGKALELIDTVPGDLAALGLVPALTVSSQEPAVEVAINNSATGLSETLDVASTIALSIGYAGTTATATINQTTKTLTTTVVGGAGASLSVDLTQFRTIGDLATFINSQTGYSASAAAAAQQQPTSALDTVTAVGVAATASSAKPGRIKNAASTFQKVLATSRALTFAPTATAGVPAAVATTFLSGGARGATLAADIVNALAQLAGVQVNIIVPLFSQDSSADIAAGITDSSSTYTVDSIHAAVKNHCIQFSTPKLKKNRMAVLSAADTFANIKQKAQNLANYRCALTMQAATAEDASGNLVVFQPWMTAVVAAGMQTGGFYKSLTNKLANVVSFSDPTGFDSGSPGSVEDALTAGLLFLTKDVEGNRWVSDQTTYGFDTNFVYNSIQAVYTSDILALDLAASFQNQFVGKSLADVDATTALSFLSQKMEGYKKIKLTASSSDAPLGFKNAKVTINGPEMNIEVEIKLATAIYFIPISIAISQVTQSAG